jgi:hypothetical protein
MGATQEASVVGSWCVVIDDPEAPSEPSKDGHLLGLIGDITTLTLY